MILRARVVVTMNGAPIENGAVAISGNHILDVGTFDEIKAHRSGQIIDLGEQALLPGLINAHCHLDYTCLRGKIPPQKSFADWIRAINAQKAKLSPEDYVASINEGFTEAKRFGTTTIANLTAFPDLISCIRPPIRTWWLAELIDVREPERAQEIVDLAVESLKRAEHWGLAPHALFTASADLYRRCEQIAPLLTTHLAESREEMSMFRDAGGPLYEFLKGIGRDMNDCAGQTPLEEFVGRLEQASPRKWIVVHLNELTDGDLDLLATPTKIASRGSTLKFHVVHCPRSHNYFAHSPFQFERLRELRFNICLGTDSLASNEDLSLFAEMREFQKSFVPVSPEEILAMVTLNPARALGMADALGRIRSGYFADLMAIPFNSLRKNLFEQIVAFEGAVTFLITDGETKAVAQRR
jgi:cytosine/adenosine deaminase-related metal-dependent hydrolase